MSIRSYIGDTSERRSVKVGFLLVAYSTLPFLFGVTLASQIVIFTVFALGYNLLLGYGGEMSFGHAAFFGLGAYGTVLTAQFVPNLAVAILSGILMATVAGVVIGLLSLQRRGIYFSMITLAFAQMIYYVFLQATSITGGSNGIVFPSVSGYGPLAPGNSTVGFYFVCLLLLLGVFVVVRRIVRSPFGRVLVSIRENEQRARALGYDIDRFLLLGFVFSAFFSGLAGAFYTLLFSFVSPEVLFWSISGNIVMIAIIGGVGTLGGQFIGTGVFLILEDYLTDFFNVWEVIFGLIIVGFVMLAPEGIYGLYKKHQRCEGTYDARDAAQRLLRVFR